MKRQYSNAYGNPKNLEIEINLWGKEAARRQDFTAIMFNLENISVSFSDSIEVNTKVSTNGNEEVGWVFSGGVTFKTASIKGGKGIQTKQQEPKTKTPCIQRQQVEWTIVKEKKILNESYKIY